jgi:hypothetical protein
MTLDLQIHKYAVGFTRLTYSFATTLMQNKRLDVVSKIALFVIGGLSPTFVKRGYFNDSKSKDYIILTQALKKSFPDFFSDIDVNDVEKVIERVKVLVKELKKYGYVVNSLDESNSQHIQD